jgi:putative ABC transport system permease protein
MRIIIHHLTESIIFAVRALQANVLRAALTLTGVTIGIFSIISVFTAIDFLEDKINDSIKSLGDNVVYVQKWPWTPPEGESEYPWWRYLNRPQPTINELAFLQKRSQLADGTALIISTRQDVSYYDNKYGGGTIMGVTHEFEDVWSFAIEQGRYFTMNESNNGAKVALIGHKLAKELFRGQGVIGKKVKITGVQYEIIGVFEKKGDDMFGSSLDENIVIPMQQAKRVYNIRSENVGPTLILKGKPNVKVEDLADEVTGLMRENRRLKPSQENNFAINQVSLVQKNFDSLFSIIDFAGWFIGGFSILVGGFGIANIMFVSVRERTRIIGIQKALGAKKAFILSQFLFEGVFLALLGGVVGLLLIFMMVSWLNVAFDVPFKLSLYNIILGTGISVCIGIVSGFVPAWMASRMNPVNAINQV